jgi:hypothetical protein
MEEKDAKIFVTSVKNASKRLEAYGQARLEGLSLLRLIYKYACFSTTYKSLQRLNTMVSTLQLTDPLICMERQALASYPSNIGTVGTVTLGAGGATPPTLADIALTLDDSTSTYVFSYTTLFSGYSDDEGGAVASFVINVLPIVGALYYNGALVTTNTLLYTPSLLTYVRSGTTAYGDSFTFSAYNNDTQVPLVSNVANSVVTVEEIVLTNEPSTVGDRAQYSENRTTTVFTVEDFTTQAIAPYFDPEANDLDAIRIDEISTANLGVYYYLGSPVVEGQVITNSELALGAFYHVSPDANSISTDSFNASVRDTGSLIWVQ